MKLNHLEKIIFGFCKYYYFISKFHLNVWRFEHVAGFGALLYQKTPKLDARLKAK
jgi:hypothetical protein